MTFEDRYSQIAGTDLWKLLVKRSEEAGLGREFISAVGDVCSIGLDLSRSIIRFFPTFTLHDGTHSANVCRWMYRLLDVRAEELTAYEAALLLMAACCHDIGMSVTDAQKQAMLKRTYTGWDDYFRKHLVDAICGHQRPLVRWQTATVRCVSGQPELAFSRRFCGGERPVCGPAATYSK